MGSQFLFKNNLIVRIVWSQISCLHLNFDYHGGGDLVTHKKTHGNKTVRSFERCQLAFIWTFVISLKGNKNNVDC